MSVVTVCVPNVCVYYCVTGPEPSLQTNFNQMKI